MIMSKTKSIVTNLRSKIVTLSYECNLNQPKKDIRKLTAQLCFPERKFKPKFQSYRAIGYAYAACGSDPTFHHFCEVVYSTFKSIMAEYSDKIRKYIPGQFSYLEDNYSQELFQRFPTIVEVQQLVRRDQGALHFAPRWKNFHFMNNPDHNYPLSKTMLQYEIDHDIDIFKRTHSSGSVFK